MKRVLTRLSVVLAVLCAVGMMAQNAYAAPGAVAFAVEGSGSISPGLTLTPTSQSVSFNGTIAGLTMAAPGVAAGVGNCSFSGTSDAPETQLQGAGTVSGNCSGATVGVTAIVCIIAYVRVGSLVVIRVISCTWAAASVSGSGASASAGTGAGVFVFVPTSAPGGPVTAYALAGVAGGVGT